MTTETAKKPKKSTKTPAGTKVRKEFSFPLTDAEYKEKGMAAAALSGEIESLETQFKEVKASWTAKIESREAHRDDHLSVIRAKKQMKTVDSTMVKDYDAKEIQYWFEGKIIERRTMTAEEMQVELPMKETKKKAEATRQKLERAKDASAAAATAKNGANPEISDIIKEETGRRTKFSVVDGPRQ